MSPWISMLGNRRQCQSNIATWGTLDDATMVKKLFDTVPNRFISVVAGVEQFYDLKTLLFEEAVGRLKAFEEWIQRGAGGLGAKTNSSGQLLLT